MAQTLVDIRNNINNGIMLANRHTLNLFDAICFKELQRAIVLGLVFSPMGDGSRDCHNNMKDAMESRFTLHGGKGKGTKMPKRTFDMLESIANQEIIIYDSVEFRMLELCKQFTDGNRIVINARVMEYAEIQKFLDWTFAVSKGHSLNPYSDPIVDTIRAAVASDEIRYFDMKEHPKRVDEVEPVKHYLNSAVEEFEIKQDTESQAYNNARTNPFNVEGGDWIYPMAGEHEDEPEPEPPEGMVKSPEDELMRQFNAGSKVVIGTRMMTRTEINGYFDYRASEKVVLGTGHANPFMQDEVFIIKKALHNDIIRYILSDDDAVPLVAPLPPIIYTFESYFTELYTYVINAPDKWVIPFTKEELDRFCRDIKNGYIRNNTEMRSLVNMADIEEHVDDLYAGESFEGRSNCVADNLKIINFVRDMGRAKDAMLPMLLPYAKPYEGLIPPGTAADCKVTGVLDKDAENGVKIIESSITLSEQIEPPAFIPPFIPEMEWDGNGKRVVVKPSSEAMSMEELLQKTGDINTNIVSEFSDTADVFKVDLGFMRDTEPRYLHQYPADDVIVHHIIHEDNEDPSLNTYYTSKDDVLDFNDLLSGSAAPLPEPPPEMVEKFKSAMLACKAIAMDAQYLWWGSQRFDYLDVAQFFKYFEAHELTGGNGENQRYRIGTYIDLYGLWHDLESPAMVGVNKGIAYKFGSLFMRAMMSTMTKIVRIPDIKIQLMHFIDNPPIYLDNSLVTNKTRSLIVSDLKRGIIMDRQGNVLRTLDDLDQDLYSKMTFGSGLGEYKHGTDIINNLKTNKYHDRQRRYIIDFPQLKVALKQGFVYGMGKVDSVSDMMDLVERMNNQELFYEYDEWVECTDAHEALDYWISGGYEFSVDSNHKRLKPTQETARIAPNPGPIISAIKDTCLHFRKVQ